MNIAAGTAVTLACVVLGVSAAQAATVSSWQAQAVKEQVAAQQSHVTDAAKDGKLSAEQAGRLSSEIAAVGRAEHDAEHDGGIDDTAYHELNRQLSKLAAQLLQMERTTASAHH